MNRKKWQAKPITLFLTVTGLFCGGVGIFKPLVTPTIASAISLNQSRFLLALNLRLPPKGAPGKRRGASTRDGYCSSDEEVIALVPGTNLGLTVAERPTFLVYVPYESNGLEAEFSLKDREGNEVYQQIVALKNTPGIVKVRLPETVSPLDVEQLYSWRFSVRCNPSNRLDDAFVYGGVERMPMSSELESQLQDKNQRERIAVYAENGLWFDVLTTTIQRPITDVVAIVNAFNRERLQHLHKLLIQPIADLLPKNENDRVIFIPHQQLFLVPFPALQDEAGNYLIEKHTILTVPSIEVLSLTREKRQQLPNSVQGAIVVGNPTMPSVTTKAGEPPKPLSDLPHAETEAKKIAQLLNTQALTGNSATKAAILPKLSQARIIHLATHGLLDDFKGLGVPGAIALAPSGTGELNDGLLTAGELLQMKLNAELVVLSACKTGQGDITSDGVIGLSRSLVAAGVPSIIVSL